MWWSWGPVRVWDMHAIIAPCNCIGLCLQGWCSRWWLRRVRELADASCTSTRTDFGANNGCMHSIFAQQELLLRRRLGDTDAGRHYCAVRQSNRFSIGNLSAAGV